MRKMLCVLLVLFFTAPLVFAQTERKAPAKYSGKRGNVSQSKWWELPKIAEALQLSEGEKEKLDALYLEARKKSIDLRADVQKEQLELNQVMDGKQFSSEKAVNQYKNLQKAQNELALVNFKYQAAVRELLGDERYQKVRSLAKQARLQRQAAERKKRENRRPEAQPAR